ncbi:MAG: V-type ATP synthase subunit A, partial [Bacteroidales bacterium]|nr:V-type ATP synthase subunit A [Bacteroidales bacterium]
KYLEYDEVKDYLSEKISPGWHDQVTRAKNILRRGREAHEQINILGDDGVPLDYHVRFWKSEVIDFIILQQDAFDEIDQSTSLERQEYMLNKVLEINDRDLKFNNFEEVSSFFKMIINLLKQMNYSEFESDAFNKYQEELDMQINDIAVL